MLASRLSVKTAELLSEKDFQAWITSQAAPYLEKEQLVVVYKSNEEGTTLNAYVYSDRTSHGDHLVLPSTTAGLFGLAADVLGTTVSRVSSLVTVILGDTKECFAACAKHGFRHTLDIDDAIFQIYLLAYQRHIRATSNLEVS